MLKDALGPSRLRVGNREGKVDLAQSKKMVHAEFEPDYAPCDMLPVVWQSDQIIISLQEN